LATRVQQYGDRPGPRPNCFAVVAAGGLAAGPGSLASPECRRAVRCPAAPLRSRLAGHGASGTVTRPRGRGRRSGARGPGPPRGMLLAGGPGCSNESESPGRAAALVVGAGAGAPPAAGRGGSTLAWTGPQTASFPSQVFPPASLRVPKTIEGECEIKIPVPVKQKRTVTVPRTKTIMESVDSEVECPHFAHNRDSRMLMSRQSLSAVQWFSELLRPALWTDPVGPLRKV
jgi:hypothetical protein